MHPIVSLPLASLVGAAVLAGAVVSREPDRRARRLTGASALCAGLWALFALLAQAAPDAELAARYLRGSALGSIPIAALVLHRLAAGAPEPRRAALARLVAPAWAATAVALVLALATDLVTPGAVAEPWGFAPLAGAGLPWAYALVVPLPLAGALAALLPGAAGRDRQLHILATASGAACFALATLTDFALPLAGVPFPPLGHVGVVLFGAGVWWSVYRSRAPTFTPGRFAREILDTLPDGVALVRDGRLRTANRRLAELAGRRPADLIGQPLGGLLAEGPDDPVSADGERETFLRVASGQLIPVSVVRAPLADPGALGQVLVVRDLREVAALRSHLIASGRLVAVGQLAAGIAHEINNPIAYVRANLGLLASSWAELGAAVRKRSAAPLVERAVAAGPPLLQRISGCIDRVAAVVRDVGGLSQGRGGQAQSSQLAQILDTAVRIAAPLLGEARVERQYEEVPRVACVRQEILQIFLDLLLEAAHEVPPDARIRLALWPDGEQVVVEIAREGGARPRGEAVRNRLAIAHAIAERHGGSIEVESDAGRGPRYRVRLPASAAAGVAGPDAGGS